MSKRDDLINKIKALRERTVENGCSESEALSAANMLSKMMEKHGVSISEIDIKQADCVSGSIRMGARKIPSWMRYLSGLCSDHYDTEPINQKTGNIHTIIFFGFPEDVEATTALFNMLHGAINVETTRYCLSDNYKEARWHTHTNILMSSFRKGILHRVMERLKEIKDDRDKNIEKATGTSLVLVKSEKVAEDLKIAFPELGKADAPKQEALNGEALRAGYEVGKQININNQIGE